MASGCYERILETVRQMPVVDCHEHLAVPSEYVTPREPIAFLLGGYFSSDLLSAGMSQGDLQILQDDDVSTERKWPIFRRFWARTEHTAYAREVKDTMRSHGEGAIDLDSVKRFGKRIRPLSEETYLDFINSLNIKALLVDILYVLADLQQGVWTAKVRRFVEGKVKLPKCFLPLIRLTHFHWSVRSFQSIQDIAGILDKTVTSLQEFLDTTREIMFRLKERGAVGMKDQSAYFRSLDFAPATRAEAEELFKKCLANPNNSLGWPEAKPLDDFLFHEYMRFAREMDLPVQVHTGHMGGIRNRVDKANAAHLTQVLELHRDVAFDLFHGNYPYMGDLLFLGKNYPNVHLNLCWVNVIDPIYSRNLLERAVLTVPHKKINGFGGDYGVPEMIPVHLSLAQRNIAQALSNLVSNDWLSEDEALNIAADWLFNNPNELFKLGLDLYKPNC